MLAVAIATQQYNQKVHRRSYLLDTVPFMREKTAAVSNRRASHDTWFGVARATYHNRHVQAESALIRPFVLTSHKY